MTEKRYTTVELPKPNNWGIWYDGNYLSTYEVCHLLNEYVDAKKENEQLKQDKKRLIGYLHRYGKVDVEDIDEVVLNQEYLDEWGELYGGDVE